MIKPAREIRANSDFALAPSDMRQALRDAAYTKALWQQRLARAADILTYYVFIARQSGMTLSEIGELVDLSPQRVAQIVAAAEVDLPFEIRRKGDS